MKYSESKRQGTELNSDWCRAVLIRGLIQASMWPEELYSTIHPSTPQCWHLGAPAVKWGCWTLGKSLLILSTKVCDLCIVMESVLKRKGDSCILISSWCFPGASPVGMWAASENGCGYVHIPLLRATRRMLIISLFTVGVPGKNLGIGCQLEDAGLLLGTRITDTNKKRVQW